MVVSSVPQICIILGYDTVVVYHLQYGVPIFRDPDEMNGHTRDCMTIISLMVAHCSIIPSTESLALKCIVYD